MERSHFYNNKMVTVWDDKSVKGLKFEDFKKQALMHKTYLSIPGKENREKAILDDYEKITGKNVKTDTDNSESGEIKSSKRSKPDNKGE